MLTGKFKKDQAPDEKTRAGFFAKVKKEGKGTVSYYDDVANEENFWTLMDVMEKVAKNHGTVLIIITQVDTL